jgi:predicted transcriptional regulator
MISDIIDVFIKEFGREITINQISKELKKSYGSVNMHCNQLIDKGVLDKKNIGNAIVCRLNYKNDLVLGNLVLNSIMKTSGKTMPSSITALVSAKETTLVFRAGNSFYYQMPNAVPPKSQNQAIKKAKENLKEIDDIMFKKIIIESLHEITIFHGHENFWRKVKEL